MMNRIQSGVVRAVIAGMISASANLAWAAAYFVSPSGDDNNSGLETSPWKTIQKAANTAVAGDTVTIRGGIYQEHVVLKNSGTPSSRIVFAAQPGEQVVLDGTAIPLGSTDGLFDVANQHYITVRGLEIRNSSRNGIRAVYGTHIILEELSIDGAGESGIAFYNNPVASHSIIRRSTVKNTTTAGIVLWSNTGGRYLIEGNTVSDVSGKGNWDGIQAGDTPYTIIQNNIITGVGAEGDYIDVGGNQTISPSNAHHIVIQGNKVIRGSGGPGRVKVNNHPRYAIVRNNIIYGSGLTFYEQPHAQVAVYHNTIVDGEHAVQFWNKDETVPFGGIKVKNNVLASFSAPGTLIQHSPSRLDASPANILMDGNVYRFLSGYGIEWAMAEANRDYGPTVQEYDRWRNETGQEPTKGGTYTTVSSSQLFIDPGQGNFALTADSPAIDSGVELTKTTSAGTGTQIAIAESFYFFDGYGLTSGDLVRVGNNPAVRITAIDEANNRMTVETAITWNAGDPVTLTYSGKAPDAGAMEFVVPEPAAPVNVALASNGTVASASSTYKVRWGRTYPITSVNDNKRSGAGWEKDGGWNDATINAFPDWVQLKFNQPQRIGQVVVYTLQDDFKNPVEPNDSLTFSKYGVTHFDVQGWTGKRWTTVAIVRGNNLVKRTVNFKSLNTDRIRILIRKALAGYSRLVEVEAFDR